MPLQDSFHPDTYAKAIQDEKITVTGGVPTMLAMQAEHASKPKN